MTNQTRDSERRRFSRVPFSQRAEIEFGEKKSPCRLVDISMKGALIEPIEGVALKPGDKINLSLLLDDGSSVVQMALSVVHAAPERMGCRCEEIDLDSITHLRRLLELNLGDAALATRELAELA